MRPALWLLPFAILLSLFLFAPLVLIVINAFRSEEMAWGLSNFQDIFTSSFYLQSIVYAVEISLYSSIVALLIALPGAYSLSVLKPSRFSEMVLAFNSMVSNFTGVPLAFAFMILLGTNGVFTLLMKESGMDNLINLYGKEGITIVYAYFQIPLAVLLLYPACDAVKQEWKESAALLGASNTAFWRHVGLPVLAPALGSTAVILFANAIGAYATVYALTQGNFNIMPVRIAALVSGDIFLEPNKASALSLLLIAILVIVAFINRIILRPRTKGIRA